MGARVDGWEIGMVRSMPGADTFVKRGQAGATSLPGEAASLRWLGEATRGVPVARVLTVSETELVEERVRVGSASRAAAERVGVALAHTHAAGAPWWGCPPTGWEGDQLIEGTRTPTIDKASAPDSWGYFFADVRIAAYVRQARDRHVLSSDECALVERVCDRLRAGAYDAEQPGLVSREGHQVARIHGDLWAGNLLWDADPTNPVGAVLIDPMAHGGHAETDLAMLALFGCSHLDRIVAAYHEASPLADGWRERVGLHQLAPLLHHCVLFGRSYVAETMAVARRYA